jgi:hypothetical protein
MEVSRGCGELDVDGVETRIFLSVFCRHVSGETEGKITPEMSPMFYAETS